MVVLVGYSANAAGITLGNDVIKPGIEDDDPATSDRDPALVATVAFFLASKVARSS
jgi:hypothetical protein